MTGPNNLIPHTIRSTEELRSQVCQGIPPSTMLKGFPFNYAEGFRSQLYPAISLSSLPRERVKTERQNGQHHGDECSQ